MDQQIKLRNADTEQECAFDDRAAADHFTQNIADPDAWQLVHEGDDPAIQEPAPKRAKKA